jgi:Skp family chaperone for outer membrane proteins
MIATCLAWACFSSHQASAQAPMGPTVQGPGGIALVDVNYILKNHVRLRAQLEQLGNDAKAVQKDFEQQLQHLQEQEKQLRLYKPGTPEYQSLEESMVTQKANIQGQIALKRKDFVQKEAHLYFNAYREISAEVADFCQQRGIALVLNFNGDKMRDDNADEIARGISKHVIFYTTTLDVTPDIMRRFARPITANPGGPTGFAPVQR